MIPPPPVDAPPDYWPRLFHAPVVPGPGFTVTAMGRHVSTSRLSSVAPPQLRWAKRFAVDHHGTISYMELESATWAVEAHLILLILLELLIAAIRTCASVEPATRTESELRYYEVPPKRQAGSAPIQLALQLPVKPRRSIQC